MTRLTKEETSELGTLRQLPRLPSGFGQSALLVEGIGITCECAQSVMTFNPIVRFSAVTLLQGVDWTATVDRKEYHLAHYGMRPEIPQSHSHQQR